jgi:hypothetical protein
MILARAVQMTLNQIIHVVTMWNSLMTARRPMLVLSVMALMMRSAGAYILRRFSHNMLIHVIPVHMMHMPIMQIIGVPFMLHGSVSAVDSVRMIVVLRMSITVTAHSPYL